MKRVSSETIPDKNLQHADVANQSYENQFNPAVSTITAPI